MCDQTLASDELESALMEMVDDKLPRLDCFPCEFYKVKWDFVRLGLLQVYKEAIRKKNIQ